MDTQTIILVFLGYCGIMGLIYWAAAAAGAGTFSNPQQGDVTWADIKGHWQTYFYFGAPVALVVLTFVWLPFLLIGGLLIVGVSYWQSDGEERMTMWIGSLLIIVWNVAAWSAGVWW